MAANRDKEGVKMVMGEPYVCYRYYFMEPIRRWGKTAKYLLWEHLLNTTGR